MRMKVLFGVGCVCLALLVGVGTSVVAGPTEVTVTKTSSRYIATSAYDGTYMWYAFVHELDTGYSLTYFVSTVSPHAIIEYGSGVIDKTDVAIGTTSASLDVDTTDIATVGDGGQITLTWTGDDLTTMEMDGKSIYRMGDQKTISLTGMTQSSAVVSGTFLGDDYTSTGSITTNKGKVITQVKD